MMMRKRSRAVQKDQFESQSLPDSTSGSNTSCATSKTKSSTSFFSVPGLITGFNSKCLSSDSDSVRSPTSPLDFKVLSHLGNTFIRSSPSSPGINGSPRKIWDSHRVGLGLLDSVSDDSSTNLPDGRNIIFGSKMRINISSSPKTCLDRTILSSSVSSPKSLPKNYMISSQTIAKSSISHLGSSLPVRGTDEDQMKAREMGKIHSYLADMGGNQPSKKEFMYPDPKFSSEEFPVDFKKSQLDSSLLASDVDFCNSPGLLPVCVGSVHKFMGTLSASEIESSEDYTRIISRGPNPKTTHIFGDCILESYSSDLSGIAVNNIKGEEPKDRSSWLAKSSDDTMPSPADNFLSFCFFCKNKLIDGEDIYMYRGEKAFCSCSCRAQEILINEETDNKLVTNSSDFLRSESDEDIFFTGMVITSKFASNCFVLLPEDQI